MLTKEIVLSRLEKVIDPEIPLVSIVEMGMVKDVLIQGNSVKVEFRPTFAGCPAIEYIKNDIIEALQEENISINVEVVNDEWSTNLITEEGLKKLEEFGLSAPPKVSSDSFIELTVLQNAKCPHCGSYDTKLMSPFGPSLCRAIHHCDACGETFEQFKPV